MADAWNIAGGKRGESGVLAVSSGVVYSPAVAVTLGAVTSFHMTWVATAGSLEAVVELQASNDKKVSDTTDSGWATYDLTPTITGPESTDRDVIFEFDFSASMWYRIRVTYTSGSGSVQFKWCTKDSKG